MLEIIITSLITLFPVAVASAICIHEYCQRDKVTGKVLEENKTRVHYSAPVNVVLELLRSEPEEWNGAAVFGYKHPAGIRIDTSFCRGSYSTLDLYVDDVRLKLNNAEKEAIGAQLTRNKQIAEDRERAAVTKALARRILDRKKAVLDESRLGDGKPTQKGSVGSSTPTNTGYLAYDRSTGRIIQTMSGDSVKLVLDSKLKERYGLVR